MKQASEYCLEQGGEGIAQAHGPAWKEEDIVCFFLVILEK